MEHVEQSPGCRHCVGSTALYSAGNSNGQLTATTLGVALWPERVELNGTADLVVTGMTIGGLPIMHGGKMPGDSFRADAVYGLRSALPITPNAPLIVSVSVRESPTVNDFSMGVKGRTEPFRG